MTWQEVTVWNWFCDGCDTGMAQTYDGQPDGWMHTQDGRDLCPACQR